MSDWHARAGEQPHQRAADAQSVADPHKQNDATCCLSQTEIEGSPLPVDHMRCEDVHREVSCEGSEGCAKNPGHGERKDKPQHLADDCATRKRSSEPQRAQLRAAAPVGDLRVHGERPRLLSASAQPVKAQNRKPSSAVVIVASGTCRSQPSDSAANVSDERLCV